jgi:hypothetical protein
VGRHARASAVAAAGSSAGAPTDGLTPEAEAAEFDWRREHYARRQRHWRGQDRGSRRSSGNGRRSTLTGEREPEGAACCAAPALLPQHHRRREGYRPIPCRGPGWPVRGDNPHPPPRRTLGLLPTRYWRVRNLDALFPILRPDHGIIDAQLQQRAPVARRWRQGPAPRRCLALIEQKPGALAELRARKSISAGSTGRHLSGGDYAFASRGN